MHDMTILSDNPDDFCFFDTETRALDGLEDHTAGDVTICGAARYSRNAKVNVFRYAIGNGPLRRWDLEDFDKMLRWRDAPPDLLKFLARALKGEAWFVAFNSGFDRQVANNSMLNDAPDGVVLPIRCVLDAMAQAVAANLPAKLEDASRSIGRGGKVKEGKKLMQIFATATDQGGGTPQTHPEEWARYQEYADGDVEELRAVFQSTRPMWRWEWEQFWASEKINDAGLPVDRHFAERAAALAEVYEGQVNVLIKKFSRDRCWSVNQHVALANLVADELEHLPEAFNILVKKYEEDQEGDGLVVSSLSLERTRVEKLIAYLERMDREIGLDDDEYAMLQLLEVRLFGASNTPKKFAKLLPMLDHRGRLCGQYVFAGAQQTGRYSSRGLQVHNLTRKTVDDEVGAVEYINDMEL